MVFHSENHHFELERILHDKMSKLYIFQAIMTFVKSALGIFVPVYLYSLGYSLIFILFYAIGISFTYIFLIPHSIKLIGKIGFKNMLFLSLPVYFLQIFSLNYASNIIFCLIAMISFGTFMALYWPAMHSEIALNGSSKQRGSQMGTLQIISTIFGVMAPLVGGFVLQIYGYDYLLIISIFFLVIGALPLFFAQDIKLKNYSFHYKDYFRLLKMKKFKNSRIAFSAEGIESLLALTFWPVILYILLSSSFLNLGLLFSFASFISVLIILYLKKYIDVGNKQKFLKKITRLLSINWLFRSLLIIFSSFFVYFVETFFRLTNSVFNLSYQSIFYNNAKNTVFMDYIILREIHLHSAKVIVALSYIIILYFYGENLKIFSLLIILGIVVPTWLSQFREE